MKYKNDDSKIHHFLLDSIIDIIAIHRTDGTILYASPSAQRILGYSPKKLKGKNGIVPIIHEDDRDKVYTALKQLQENSNKSVRLELRLRHQKGQYIWFETIGCLLKNSSEKFNDIITSSRDISAQKNLIAKYEDLQEELKKSIRLKTEQLSKTIAKLKEEVAQKKRSEKDLKEKSEQYCILLDESPDPIVVYDINGLVQYLNPAFHETFGWSLNEVQGKKIDYVPIENQPETEKAIKRLLNGEKILKFHTKRLRKDGKILDIQLSSSMFCDNHKNPKGCIVILRDISILQSAYKQIKKSEKKFRLLVETMNEGLITTDEKFKVTYANDKLFKLTGYELKSIRGRHLLRLTHPQNRKQIIKIIKDQIKKADGHKLYQIKLFCANGENKFVLISPIAIFDNKGQFEGSLAVVTDISQLKKAQNALKQKERDLKNKNKRLTKANTALEVLLSKYQDGEKMIERKMLSNLRHLMLPYFDKLLHTHMNNMQKKTLEIMKANLEEMVSPFTEKLSSNYIKLTKTEIEVANLVKLGKSTKEIADILCVSYKTVETHRSRIRKKLNLTGKTVSLRSHLSELH
jgi:PAS domain S-box-containing protein